VLASFIGRAYAKVILGFLKDIFEAHDGARRGDTSEPIYIVEVGAGHGRFGYLVIQALLMMKEFLPRAARYQFIAAVLCLRLLLRCCCVPGRAEL
jgi:hypothetical protein